MTAWRLPQPDLPVGRGLQQRRQLLGELAVVGRQHDALGAISGQHDGAASQVEQGADGGGHPLQGGLEAVVAEQAVGQLIQGAGFVLASLGLGSAAFSGINQHAHDQGDQQVDGQRDVVLLVVDLEMPKRR